MAALLLLIFMPPENEAGGMAAADRDLSDILERVQAWAGSREAAWAWYRTQPLHSFGNLTAEALVAEGRTEAVRRYLSRIEAGGFA